MRNLCFLFVSVIFLIFLTESCDSYSSKTRIKKQNTSKYQDLYFFGDSQCDVGNFHEESGETQPAPTDAYYEGTHTNGMLFTQYLVTNLGISSQDENNYCWIGATTNFDTTLWDVRVESIQTQVEKYISDNNGELDSEALHLFMFNGNDYLYSNPDPLISVANWFDSIELAYQSGARHFVIFTLGDTPPAQSQTPGAFELAAYHNSLVQTNFDTFVSDHPDATSWLYETDVLFQKITASPANYGFTNTDDPCALLEDPISYCPVPDEYLWWDDLHWTTSFHQILGEDLALMISEDDTEPIQTQAALEVHYYFGEMIPSQATCSCNEA